MWLNSSSQRNVQCVPNANLVESNVFALVKEFAINVMTKDDFR